MKQQTYNFRQPARRMPAGMSQPMGQPMPARPMGMPMGAPGMGAPMGRPMAPMGRPMPQQMQPMQQPGMQPANGGAAWRPPQPTMNGGNFAPPPGNPQQMMNNGMFGAGNYQQSDTMPGYEGQDIDNWQNVKLGDVRDELSQNDAQANVDQMTAFVDEMSGKGIDMSVNVDGTTTNAGNVGNVVAAIMYVANLLREPESWLPTNQKRHLDELTRHGTKVAEKLDIFAKAINQLK